MTQQQETEAFTSPDVKAKEDERAGVTQEVATTEESTQMFALSPPQPTGGAGTQKRGSLDQIGGF